MKKLYSIIAALALTFVGGVGAASVASASVEECVPSEGVEAYDEVTAEAYDETTEEAYDETIVTVEASDTWFSWTGGPSTEHPFPSENWQPDNGEHNGFNQAPGLLQRDKGESGNSDWFYHLVIAEQTEVVHHDAVIVHHEAEVVHHDAVPAVICDDPPTPTQYEATCTTLSGTVTLTDESFDGNVLTLDVSGDWDETTYALPIPAGKTLADVGTSLDIDASPIGFVGLHIHTGEGTIVFEEEPSYGGNLWSNVAWVGVAAGMGYPAFGSISEFITLNGDVPVTGIDILYTSPDASSTEVTSVSIDCTTFVFRDAVDEEPPTEEPTPTPTPTDPTPTPTETTPVVTDPPVTPSPSATPAVVSQVATPSQPLASTGSEAGWYLLGGIVLVGLGTVLTIARRRYSSQP